LFSVMCCEKPESMSHLTSKSPSSTYIGCEEVDGSGLELVR
jgi:hypothetical protein